MIISQKIKVEILEMITDYQYLLGCKIKSIEKIDKVEGTHTTQYRNELLLKSFSLQSTLESLNNQKEVT